MQFKTLAILAISASAVIAKPHRGRHSHFRPSGAFPTVTGTGSQVNATDGGLFSNTTDTTVILTRTMTETVTVTPSAAGAANKNVVNADATSDCGGVSTVTELSTQFVTVTANADGSVPTSTDNATANAVASGSASTSVVDANKAEGTGLNSVSAAAFYGSRGGRGRHSSSSAANGGYTATSAAGGYGSGSTSSSGSTPTKSTSPPSGASGSKRGISFNDASLVSAFGSSVSWAYNWASSESGSLGNVEYVPMMWGLQNVDGFASKVGNAQHVLSFNEPDLGSQSNIDPSTAAQKHKEAMQSLHGKVRIGSPAVTNGGGDMGIGWLNSFFSACGSDCPVDFIAFHWYAGAENIEYFKSHVEDVVACAQSHGISSVWLTEFKPDSGSDSAQAEFMTQAIAYLESNSAVERYAGFMASDGTMLSGGSLNMIGKAYAG